jgi:hypothetical protein
MENQKIENIESSSFQEEFSLEEFEFEDTNEVLLEIGSEQTTETKLKQIIKDNKESKKENEGEWQIQFIDPSIEENFEIEIVTKTRSNNPSYFTENMLFSTIKYELHHRIHLKSEIPYFISQISIVDSSTGKEKYELKGTFKSTLSKNEEFYEGKNSQLEHTSVSQHHKDTKSFSWEIKYYDPRATVTPVILIRSSPFTVYARRGKEILSKRKLSAFESKLEEVFLSIKKFKTPENKEKAIKVIKEKFLVSETVNIEDCNIKNCQLPDYLELFKNFE